MKLKRLTLLLAAMCVVSACSFENANAAKTEPRCAIKQSKTTFAADALKPYVDTGKLPGAINIFCKGNVQETACLGWADVEKKIPMSLDRTYMQCSQTKGFCGVTIAILVEEGKISLDDPVARYLPEFKNLKVAVKDAKGKKLWFPRRMS